MLGFLKGCSTCDLKCSCDSCALVGIKAAWKTAGTVKEFESHVSRFKSTGYEDGQKFTNKETAVC